MLLGYLRRWNAFSPAPLDLLDSCVPPRSVEVLDAATAVRPVSLYGGVARGVVGEVRYAVGGEALMRTQIAALTRLAPYCGTGARTLYGLGQAEAVAVEE